MRATLVFGLILLASIQVLVSGSTCDSSSPNHSATWGVRKYQDRMVFLDNPSMEGQFLRVKSMDLVYPKPGEGQNYIITRIELVDKTGDGSGGCGYITDGGVGQRQVTLHLKSQRGKGFAFTVAIYGLPAS